VFLPSLAVELPDGWSVAECLTLASPSGTEVRVRLDRAPEGFDSSALADRMIDHARAEVDVRDVEATTRALAGGHLAEERRFGCGIDGVESLGRVVGLVEADLALTISSAWPVADTAAETDVDTAVAGVRILRLPPVVRLPGAAPEQPASPPAPARAPGELPVWEPLLAAWRDAPAQAARPRDLSRWAPSELAVIAAILGSPAFPTVGPVHLSSMPEPALTATVEAVSRSLLARRLVSAGDDGTTVLADQIGGAMDVAVYPDLTISVERTGPGSESTWWFGVRPDRAVQVTVLSDGTRECSELEPAEVVGQLLTLAGVVDGTADAFAAETRFATFEELATGEAKVAGLNRITTAWRDAGHIVGGVFTFAVGLDDSLWDAELDPSVTGWSLRRTDLAGLHRSFADHLPGA
jgi:hypothetical protein